MSVWSLKKFLSLENIIVKAVRVKAAPKEPLKKSPKKVTIKSEKKGTLTFSNSDSILIEECSVKQRTF